MTTPPDRPLTMVPDLCQAHQRTIVNALGLGPDDPWQAAIFVANVALFQVATADGRVWKRCSKTADGKRDADDLSLVLAEIGCLGCFLLDAFDRVVRSLEVDGLSVVAERTRTDPTYYAASDLQQGTSDG